MRIRIVFYVVVVIFLLYIFHVWSGALKRLSWSFSIISDNFNIIAHNHHTNNSSLISTNSGA